MGKRKGTPILAPDKPLSEAAWQKLVRKWARDLGWICYHTRYSIGADRGFPDLVLLNRPGSCSWS